MFRGCRDNNPPWEQLSIFPNIITILSVLDEGHNGKLKHVVNKKAPDAGKKEIEKEMVESFYFSDEVGNTRASKRKDRSHICTQSMIYIFKLAIYDYFHR